MFVKLSRLRTRLYRMHVKLLDTNVLMEANGGIAMASPRTFAQPASSAEPSVESGKYIPPSPFTQQRMLNHHNVSTALTVNSSSTHAVPSPPSPLNTASDEPIALNVS